MIRLDPGLLKELIKRMLTINYAQSGDSAYQKNVAQARQFHPNDDRRPSPMSAMGITDPNSVRTSMPKFSPMSAHSSMPAQPPMMASHSSPAPSPVASHSPMMSNGSTPPPSRPSNPISKFVGPMQDVGPTQDPSDMIPGGLDQIGGQMPLETSPDLMTMRMSAMGALPTVPSQTPIPAPDHVSLLRRIFGGR